MAKPVAVIIHFRARGIERAACGEAEGVYTEALDAATCEACLKAAKKDPEVARLEKIIEEMEKHREYFSTITRVEDLVGFLMDYVGDGLSSKDLGKLVAAFNDAFSYGLFVQFYGANDRRGQYRLFAIRRQSSVWTGEWERKIPKEDETAMRHFIRGFVAAVESRKKKGLRR